MKSWNTHAPRALALLAVFAVAAQASPLPSDERIQTGKLSNGVTWMYRQHDNPPGKMTVMVHFRTGSLNETEAQRGLAHFMEHMCFNGTENYPPGEVIEYFESLGMEFGADINAFTGFDQTAYMLFLPDTEVEQISKGLMTLSDFAFRALLLEEEIDKERGVIMEEWRSGKSAQQRVGEKSLELVFAGSHFGERLPIGLPEVIQHAPRQAFVDYYRTWYRPELTTVLVVGDAPAEKSIPLIEKWFGEYKSEMPQGKAQAAGFKKFSEARAFVITDPELAGCEVEFTNIESVRPPVTTEAGYRTELVERIGNWIVNRRLRERVEAGDASYRRAYTSVGSYFNDALLATGSAQGEPEDWNKMLDELVTEVARAREHGFSERELELAKKEILSDAKRAVETEPTRSARGVLFGMMSKLTSEEPIMGAAQELVVVEKLLPTVKLSEVSAAYSSHFSAETFAFVVTMPSKEGIAVPNEEAVLTAAKSAWKRPTKPLEEKSGPAELLAAAPKPGKLIETTLDEDLKITSGWLDNGIRVHHRFMDYKKDQVLVGITLAGGRIEETEENLGVTELVARALSTQPATSRVSSTNVRDLLTGKNVGVRMGSGPDTLNVTVSGSPADLEVGMQLAYALLTDGQIEESAVKVWKQQQIQRLTMAQSFPEFKAFEALMDGVGGGDPRMHVLLAKENVDALTLAAAQAWYNRLREKAPIEVAVVGEIEHDEAMKLVAQYLGSLPVRNRSAAGLDSLRSLKREKGPLVRHVDVATVTPKAMAIAGFVGCEAKNVQDVRGLELASETLTSRLIKRIREELGLVYSLQAGNMPSRAYEDAGMFVTQSPCDPDKVGEVVKEAHKLFTEFAKTGPTEEQLATAKKQIANNLDESMREPGYWLGVLQDFTYRGKSLDDEKNELAAYESFTIDDVKKVFNKYYLPERQFSVTAIPDKPVETAPEPTAAPTS